MVWLSYNKEIVAEILNQDGLIVMGQGLGLLPLEATVVQLHCSRSSLILCINFSTEESLLILDILRRKGIPEAHLPKIINNKCSAVERIALYKKGGCFLITSRIVIVDLLNKRIDPEFITGFLIHNAHDVTDTSIEAFVVRVYRAVNRLGFIKAFTDQASRLLHGPNKLEAVLKNLYLQQVWFYPRFHQTIASCFEQYEPIVHEIEVPMSKKMEIIQEAIIVALQTCLTELRKVAKHLDASELTIKNALLKSLDRSIRTQLDPIWHRLPVKTKQLVNDLGTLRQILYHLTRYDCISFYTILQTLKVVNGQQAIASMWLYTEAADRIFRTSKERLYKVVPVPEPETETTSSSSGSTRRMQLALELDSNPKWQALAEVLIEVDQHMSKHQVESSYFGGTQILIMAKDDRTCVQLREFLAMGGERMMKHRFLRYAQSQLAQYASRELLNIEQKCLSETYHAVKDELRRSQKLDEFRQKAPKKRFRRDNVEVEGMGFGISTFELEFFQEEEVVGDIPLPAGEHQPKRTQCEVLGSDGHLAIMSYHNAQLWGSILDDLHPSYVVLFDPDIKFIRELETYNAKVTAKKSADEPPLQIYFLMYEESAEQQLYLTTLAKEKAAFEQLIQTKATLMFPRNPYEELDRIHEAKPVPLSLDTRTTKPKVIESAKKILCDVREFRSALPSLLHKDGFQVIPLTLEIGDFVLTPDICIERKSVADLYGSFKSGRLYNQMEQFQRYYKNPILLIEFTPGKSFALQAASQLGEEISFRNIISKLTVLILHFPMLRILWSRTPHMTVKLYRSLKHNLPDPEVVRAVRKGQEGSDEYIMENALNLRPMMNPLDVLMKLPGVNVHNKRKIMDRVSTLAELATLEKDECIQLLGRSNGTQLHTFLHRKA